MKKKIKVVFMLMCLIVSLLGNGQTVKASEYDSIELKNSCTQLDNYQAEQLYMVALKNIMQRFGTDYKFENYKINIRDAGEKDSLYMVDVDIDVDMTWTKNPIESDYIKGMKKAITNIRDNEERQMIQKEVDDEITDLMEMYNEKQLSEFSYRVELGKTNGKISIDNAKFYHRVDVDDDDVYTAKMPDNEEKNYEMGENDGEKFVEESLIDTFNIRSVSYNKNSAVKYAKDHAKDAPEFSSANGMGSDCANFVSKCLHAGGIPIDKDGKWYPSSQSGAYAGDNWMRTGYYNNGGVIPYMTGKGYFSKGTASSSKLGSIIYWNDKNHVALVTYKDSNNTIKYTQHSSSTQSTVYKVYSSSMNVKFYNWNN